MAHLPPSVRFAFLTLAILLGLAAVGALAWLGYGNYQLQSSLASTTAAYAAAQQQLANEQASSTALAEALVQAQATNASFSGQINDIASTVGTLSKLASTDPQLLAKYSKIYFLNENYVPAELSAIASSSIYQKGQEIQFESQALPFLDGLIQAAANDGVTLQVISGYRSFTTQAQLKGSYRVTYGTGANAFSADQGYSEHQLGTALDFTTAKLGANFSNGFEKTDGYAWLVANAYQYGFILSYPPKNAYYEYEPWHWRFVGVALATKLHDDGQNFYDLDQRTINTYLVNLFDQPPGLLH